MHDRPLSPAEQHSEVIVDSMVLMHYDNGLEAARSWWEETVSGGVRIFVSEISLMERYKGVANLPGPREERLREFEERIMTMRKERKIYRVLRINALVARRVRELLRDYCLNHTPPQHRGRREALICDMFIAATAMLKGLPVMTFNAHDFEWIDGLQVLRPDYEPEEAT